MYSIFVLSLILHVLVAQHIINSGLSSNDIKVIVDEHNQIRKKLEDGEVPGQPRAINLQPLAWDDQLAEAAQELTNRCEFEHVTVQDERFKVGQNLALLTSSKIETNNWRDYIMSWYNESQIYIYGRVGDIKQHTGHYTQLIWNTTKLVGCGFTLCQNNSNYAHYLICNYGPKGNKKGYYPYQTA